MDVMLILVSPPTIASHRAALETAFADGPHPTQVAHRDWERRRWQLLVTAGNGYRPPSHFADFEAAEQCHAYLLSQVLTKEGLHRLIVRIL